MVFCLSLLKYTNGTPVAFDLMTFCKVRKRLRIFALILGFLITAELILNLEMNNHSDTGFYIGPDRQKYQFSYGEVDNRQEIPVEALDLPKHTTKDLKALPSIGRNLGQNGSGVVIHRDALSPEELAKYEQGWRDNQYNQFISNAIPLNRSLPDIRDPSCKVLIYPHDLPTTSVVIIFHNEAWSTLLRTVYSVLTRSPGHLIREIILVDDNSTQDHLKAPLEQYIARNLPKVDLIRTQEREGLIRARLLGARVARAQVLVFLDAHCECTPGWLEPLLYEVHKQRNAIAIPIIDSIDDNDFRYKWFPVDRQSVIGGFTWKLQFVWMGQPKPTSEKNSLFTDPIRTPTMPGGLFAVNREYFFELGGYDPGMNIWGGENIELSFRTWMCGGEMKIIPCSRVGHLYRKKPPPALLTGQEDNLRNSIRTAEVWLDDYKTYFYNRLPRPPDTSLFSDVEERVELRQRLNCSSFQWYLEHLWPEMANIKNPLASGLLQSQYPSFDSSGRPLCVQTIHKRNHTLMIASCDPSNDLQYWWLTRRDEIRRDNLCMSKSFRSVKLFPCRNGRRNQRWAHLQDGAVRNVHSRLCLELSDDLNIQLADCTGLRNQRWTWQTR